MHPGADPSRIRPGWHGAQGLEVNAQGQLEVSTPVGGVREEKAYAYQEAGDKQVEVPSAYWLDSTNSYRFELGAYDRTRPLVADPVARVYFFQFGGSSSDRGSSVAVGPFGTIYVTGSTSSSDFPVTSGPRSSSSFFGDIFVAKVNSSGTALIYAALLGGSGLERSTGIAVDSLDYAYVVGDTNSPDFPVHVGPDPTYNTGADVFVAKLNTTGTGLVCSGYTAAPDRPATPAPASLWIHSGTPM